MVLGVAKKMYKKAKSAVGLGSEDEFERIDSSVDEVMDAETSINQELSEINETYSEKSERAREMFLGPEDRSVSLDSIGVEDPVVRINNGSSLISGLFGEDNNVIELNSESLGEYVEDLVDEIDVRVQEINDSQEALEQLGMDTTVGELLGAEPDEDDSYASSLIKSANVGRMMVQKQEEVGAEYEALQEELSSTIDQYTQKLYEEATQLSEDLGGTKRSGKGEFDRLRDLADSRANLLEKGSESQAISNSRAVRESREALANQAELVNQYLQKLSSYRDSIERLYETGEDKLDEEHQGLISDRLDSIDEGLRGLKDVVNYQEYDSLQEALEDTVAKGLRTGESLPNTGFNFEETESHESRQDAVGVF